MTNKNLAAFWTVQETSGTMPEIFVSEKAAWAARKKWHAQVHAKFEKYLAGDGNVSILVESTVQPDKEGHPQLELAIHPAALPGNIHHFPAYSQNQQQ